LVFIYENISKTVPCPWPHSLYSRPTVCLKLRRVCNSACRPTAKSSRMWNVDISGHRTSTRRVPWHGQSQIGVKGKKSLKKLLHKYLH